MIEERQESDVQAERLSFVMRFLPKGRLGLSNGVKFLLLLVYTFGLGLLLSYAFAPYNQFWVIFICFPLLFLLLAWASKVGRLFSIGWCFSFGFFFSGLYWLGYSFTQQGPNPSIAPVFAPVAVMGLAMFLGLYGGGSFWLAGRLARYRFGFGGRAAIWRLFFAFIGSYFVFELARGVLLTGFPWHVLASLWGDWPYMAQSVYWFGLPGLSFLTVFGASLPGVFLLERLVKGRYFELPAPDISATSATSATSAARDTSDTSVASVASAVAVIDNVNDGQMPRAFRIGSGAIPVMARGGLLTACIDFLPLWLPFCLFFALAGAGAWRLAAGKTQFYLDMPLRLVQLAPDQKQVASAQFWPDLVEGQLALSRLRSTGSARTGFTDGDADNAAQSSGGAARSSLGTWLSPVLPKIKSKLLIWPESSVLEPTLDHQNALNRYRLARLLPFGSYALVGTTRYDYDGKDYHFYNSMMAIGAHEDIQAVYDKRHLVPFGEYLPFGLDQLFGWLGVQHLTGGSAFMPGKGPAAVRLAGVPTFLPLICYEAIFSVTDMKERPAWLLNLTNDGWFGKTAGPYQHLALARMRAMEVGLPLVRNSLSGISAVFDPWGRTIAWLDLGRQGVIDTVLPKATSAPLFSNRVRDLFFLILSISILIYTRFSRNR